MNNPLLFELTLVPVSNIVSYTDVTKAPKYNLTNAELEYQCITSDYLAQEASTSYQAGKGFFCENVIFYKNLL